MSEELIVRKIGVMEVKGETAMISNEGGSCENDLSLVGREFNEIK